MISQKKHKQQGATLLVGMIMMVVLTLLVVFGIRSGNTNLRIAGNMQTQAEASAATQQVIEQVIDQIKVTDDLSLIAGQSISVSVGNATYTVAVAPMNKSPESGIGHRKLRRRRCDYSRSASRLGQR